jgi:hypothetical protein
MLARADLIIFLDQTHYDYATQHLGYRKSNYHIWNILDLGAQPDARNLLRDESRVLEVAEKTFQDMQQKIESLVNEFS